MRRWALRENATKEAGTQNEGTKRWVNSAQKVRREQQHNKKVLD